VAFNSIIEYVMDNKFSMGMVTMAQFHCNARFDATFFLEAFQVLRMSQGRWPSIMRYLRRRYLFEQECHRLSSPES
jgi:hypothetical protein